jgi:hypothetical protein
MVTLFGGYGSDADTFPRVNTVHGSEWIRVHFPEYTKRTLRSLHFALVSLPIFALLLFFNTLASNMILQSLSEAY